MQINQLTQLIIGAAIEVHKTIGPGLLESAYEACLAYELQLRGLAVSRQLPLPLHYKQVRLDCQYRVDLVIADLVAVEIKTVEQVLPVHEAQLLTYMRLGGWSTGLLLNFHVARMREGIRRLVHNYQDPT